MVWNTANILTLTRFVIVPLVVAALLLDDGGGWRWVATGLFLLAAITDRFDGWVARRLNQVTDWGKLVDPLADKALVGAVLITLSALGDLPWWVTVVILVRELGITIMRFALLRYVVIPASPGGKIKTILQIAGIALFLVPLSTMPGWVTVVAWMVMYAAVLLTVLTGFDYLRKGLALRAAQD
jgi:CDP-diacylglycerol--glycerol-3-phosphate 3-phosphatidyltransferase